MKISGDEQYWRNIAAHTSARNSGGAPWSVQLKFAGLVGDNRVIASVSHYSPEAPSRWDILAITENARIVKLLMDFDLDRYNLEEEQNPYRKHNPVAINLYEASVRRLSDVVRLDVGDVSRRVDGFGQPLPDQIDLRDVKLTFANGSNIDLGIDQALIYEADERARTDAFLDAIRSLTGL